MNYELRITNYELEKPDGYCVSAIQKRKTFIDTYLSKLELSLSTFHDKTLLTQSRKEAKAQREILVCSTNLTISGIIPRCSGFSDLKSLD